MKWVLLVFLTISCTGNSDDMILFQTSLGSKGGSIPPVIIDGGELIALTPNLPLGEPDRGFTNTGLYYCKEETEDRNDGKMIFWCSNWGRKDNATAGDRYESFVKLAIDYQVGGGGVGDRYTAELLENINTYKTTTTSSMQGIFQRGSGGNVYVSDNGVRGYEPIPDANGDSILVHTLSNSIGPALAYDDTDDTILSGRTQTIERYDFTGALLETLAIDLSGLGANNIDHISLNTDEDILIVTYGGSGLKYFTYSTLTEIRNQTYPPGSVIDIEGCALTRNPWDNKLYVFVNSDNWFHSDGNPDTDINAIHKVLSNVFD